nr:MaoC family dehydratase N-terminal domain-containing protein [Lentzea sp. NBRC 105346]
MRLSEFTVEIDPARAREFARVIGEDDPVYLDPAAARAAGHPDLLVTPTFLFGLELEHGSVLEFFASRGAELSATRHVEQGFTYRRPVVVGDRLTFTPEITDFYRRRGNAFVVQETGVADSTGESVASLRQVIAFMGGDRG